MMGRFLWIFSAVSLAIVLCACILQGAQAMQPLAQGDRLLFDDVLDPTFQSWSFDVDVNLAATSPAYGGSARSIAVTYRPGNWGALWLVRPGGDIDLSGYTALRFAIHGGATGGQTVRVQAGAGVNYPAANEVNLNHYLPDGPVANEWRVVTIPLSDLNLAGGSLGSLAFQSATDSGQPTFYLDDLRLVAGEAPPPAAGIAATIRIQPGGVITAVDAHMLGSNLPAWLGRSRFEDQVFLSRTIASGIKLLRMPGGSWSNAYGWLSCEMGTDQPGAEPCYWPWAARPTDFINFLRATGAEGLWVVNPNGTAKEAAALVAFFNGAVDDHREIGVDIRGKDWGKVSDWAQLRAAHGNPEPLGVKLWEFGNEVYGGKPSTGGSLCQSWGWEDVWTCDGAEYVLGKGTGPTRREGYLEFREAMRAVDPTIWVGAVGYEVPGDPFNPDWQNYNNWGLKVISTTGAALDFYSIHPYPYFQPPANNAAGYAEILAKPQRQWRTIRTDLDGAFDAFASERRAPVAVTEYNLISVQDQDNAQLMTRAINALFLADSIGQAIQQGFAMFNQWDLANGRASNGTEYGLMHEDNNFYRAPQYYAFPLWARFGKNMLPVTTTLDAATQASVYAGRIDATTFSVLAINKMATSITATVAVEDGAIVGGIVYEVRAASPSAQSVLYNGSAMPSDDLSEPPMAIDAVNGELTVVLAPWSITLIQLDMQEGMSPAPSPTSTPTAEPPPTSTPVPGVMPRIYLPTVRR
jgi:alpha-L-arabinofuranosidase